MTKPNLVLPEVPVWVIVVAALVLAVGGLSLGIAGGAALGAATLVALTALGPRVRAIAGRELRALFLSPVAYVIISVYLGLVSVLWWLLTVGPYAQTTYRPIASNMHVFLMFVLPAISMRVIADERRTRTLEVLVTQPVRDYEIILGKWLACVALLAIMLAGTLHFYLQMHFWGEGDLANGPVLTAYLGLLLTGMLYLSIGVFFSSITENQVVAALLTFVVVICMYFIRFLGDNATSPFWQEALHNASTFYHFDDFSKGVLDTSHVVYCLAASFGFLFMSVRSLESRTWG